jgi:outer membrane protein W
MKKLLNLIAILMFVFAGGVAQAQEQEEEGTDSPIAKDAFTVSVNFGIGSYIGKSAPAPNLSSYTLSAPMTAWFSKTPILDVEGKWFVTDKWAVKLTGSFAYNYNPAYNEVTGTADSDATFEPGDLPTYKAVPSSNNIQYSVGVGADHYFATKNNRIFLRVGGEFGYAYGRVTANGVDSEEYLGAAIGEAYALRIAPVAGLDYFFVKQLFVGIDVRPISYSYSVYSERPQVGLKLLSSDNHSFSFIAQPTIKLGFRF